jgi:hypothetical protein
MKTIARDRDRVELVGRLGTVHEASARRWGRMSAHQMVCHVSDTLRMALGRAQVAPIRGRLPAAIVKWLALYAPLRWPLGIRTTPETDQLAGGGTRPAGFASDVAQALALLELVASESAPLAAEHPVFGRMRRSDWLRWAYLHTDHHLRQFGA